MAAIISLAPRIALWTVPLPAPRPVSMASFGGAGEFNGGD